LEILSHHFTYCDNVIELRYTSLDTTLSHTTSGYDTAMFCIITLEN